jgi:hypothetical protein
LVENSTIRSIVVVASTSLTCTGVAMTVQFAAIVGSLIDDHIRGAGKLVTGNGGN